LEENGLVKVSYLPVSFFIFRMRNLKLIKKMFKLRILNSCMIRISDGIKLTRKLRRRRRNIKRLRVDQSLIKEATKNLTLS